MGKVAPDAVGQARRSGSGRHSRPPG
jgi:hypothetical protein